MSATAAAIEAGFPQETIQPRVFSFDQTSCPKRNTFLTITAPPMALIGDENAQLALPPSQTAEKRHASLPKPSLSLEERLDQEATSLREQADGMPLSIRRHELQRKADEMDFAAQMNAWLTSPGLRAPI